MLKAFHRILPKEWAYNLFWTQKRGVGTRTTRAIGAARQNVFIRIASGIREEDLSHSERLLLDALRESPAPERRARRDLHFAEKMGRALRDGSTPSPTYVWSWIKLREQKELDYPAAKVCGIAAQQNVLIRLASGIEEKDLSQDERSTLQALRTSPGRITAKTLRFAEESGRAKRDGSPPPSTYVWSWMKRRGKEQRLRIFRRLDAGVEEKDLLLHEQIALESIRKGGDPSTMLNLELALERGRAERDGSAAIVLAALGLPPGTRITRLKFAVERARLERLERFVAEDGWSAPPASYHGGSRLVNEAINMLLAGRDEATFPPDVTLAVRRHESMNRKNCTLIEEARKEARDKRAAMLAGEPLPLFKPLGQLWQPHGAVRKEQNLALRRLRDGTCEEDLCEEHAAIIKGIRDSNSGQMKERLERSLQVGRNLRAGLDRRGNRPPPETKAKGRQRLMHVLFQRIRRGEEPGFTEEEKAFLGSFAGCKQLMKMLQRARAMWTQYLARKKVEEAAGRSMPSLKDHEATYKYYGPSRTLRRSTESMAEFQKRFPEFEEGWERGRTE